MDTDTKLTEQVKSTLSDFLNCYGHKRRDNLVKLLLTEHRTLQQSFTGFVVKWLEELSKANFDGRNEASVKLAKLFVERTTERERALPFI